MEGIAKIGLNHLNLTTTKQKTATFSTIVAVDVNNGYNEAVVTNYVWLALQGGSTTL